MKLPALSWYHDHIQYKEEELRNDLRRAFTNADYIEMVKEIAQEAKGESKAIEQITEDFQEWNLYKRKEITTVYFQLKGTSYEDREQLVNQMKDEQKIWFVREKENEYDSKAVGVWTEIEGKEHKIGYVPASISENISAVLDAGVQLTPIIMSYYTKKYSFSYYIEELNDWERDSNFIDTCCIKITFDKEAQAHFLQQKATDNEEEFVQEIKEK